MNILRRIGYYITAQTKHDVHSPFVYDLVTKVINKDKKDPSLKIAKMIRKDLLSSKKTVQVMDFGAGGNPTKSSVKKISEIARKSAKSPRYSRLLSRFCRYFQPQNVLELGTSLGLSAIYQAIPLENRKGLKFITVEGCPEISKIARENIKLAGLENAVRVETGNFDEILEGVLKNFTTLDYVFFDGNHRKEATISYFEQCLPYANNDSLFIFDDINWSDEMRQAWKLIKKHPRVSVTIDMHEFGLVFFRREQLRQDFTIRF